MVSCSAIGCSNRGENGFCMKSFPKEPYIRRKWQENVERIGWEPTKNSKLCEVHFSTDMWEKPRVDGKMKLKWNAIPTIFPNKSISKTKSEKSEPVVFVMTNSSNFHENNTEPQVPNNNDPLIITTESATSVDIKEPTTNIHVNSFVSQSSDANIPAKIIVNIENPTIFHNYAQQPDKKLEKSHQGTQVSHENIDMNDSSLSSSHFSESFVSDVNAPTTLTNTDLFKKIYQYQKSYTELLAKISNYKEEVKMLKRKNDRLVRIAKKDRHLILLKHVFNDDQICALEKSNCRFLKWSQSTLINALRLKNYCGKDGYEEILRQKIPLPSIRTLNRIKVTDAVKSMIGNK